MGFYESIDNSALGFFRNEFFMKGNYEYLLQRMWKLVRNRRVTIGNRELTRKKKSTYFL